jgi:hypothetical protein
MAVDATKLLGAAAIIHPSPLTREDGLKVAAPVLLIDSGGESDADMTAFMNGVRDTNFGTDSERYRFTEMHHGFCSGRANFADQNNFKRASEVFQIKASLKLQAYKYIADFLRKHSKALES